MKTGRRIANPTAKALAGTFRADRHADITEIGTPAKSAPIPPRYLTKEARSVWREELDRVTACGITDADSSLFARYCTMEALYRDQISAGELPKAALLTELRRMAELLGIAGLRSRLARVGTADKPTASPFTVRPKVR
ncbi:hypothetical protein [Sphingomonas sanguinis]|uniref:Uncharacterized protein n=1 Tax=Sphingomonas sanguinis TaxID=33051 RepID=A0A147ITM8_9SPHN|nr:hypothetical protein [Sphingomonas sanguinis]KTT98689.1 hypothetical protein SB4_10590 [Sphingomonas sanguinis]